jgi:hypothetical protein
MEQATQVPWMEVIAGASAGLWILSEALAQIPSVKANSVFQMVHGFLAKMAKKKEPVE